MGSERKPPLVEAYAVAPIFANGVTHIRVIGEAMSFTLFVCRPTVDGEHTERVIVAHVLISIEGVAAALPEVFAQLPAVAMAQAGWPERSKLMSN